MMRDGVAALGSWSETRSGIAFKWRRCMMRDGVAALRSWSETRSGIAFKWRR